MENPNPFLAIDQQIVGDIFTSTEAMENLVVLCDDFGSRFGGTAGEREAAEFFKAKMKAYGLAGVSLEPVEYIGWVRGTAKLEIVSPIEKTIPCITLPHSPPCDMEGVIIDMEDGAPKDFDLKADDIRGKIVMTTSVVNPKGGGRWIHRGEKYGRSMLAGAAGFIFVNHYPGYGPATGSIGKAGQSPIPGISICKEDGAFIQRLMKRKGAVKIRLVTTDQYRPMTSWNIMGDLPGCDRADEMVMMGCHYDGHDITQGAGDPISGVVAVLEAARVLAKYAPKPDCSIRFVLWGIEEIGLLGSRAYAKTHADELSRIRFYLNMDSAGTKTNNRDMVLNEWPQLASLFEGWRDEMALDFSVGQSVSAHSDHFPFFMAGVPTGGIESAEKSLAGRGYGHTRYDTVDKVDQASLREASAMAARLALRIAGESHWPVSKRDEKTVLERLDGPEYQEEKDYRERVEEYYRQSTG
jgi:aminopeptidase YwaD